MLGWWSFSHGVIQELRKPKVWRQTKVIALEKTGKDPSLALSYRLLCVCCKSLEQVVVQSSSLDEKILNKDSAKCRK